jgi:hypothetical protein
MAPTTGTNETEAVTTASRLTPAIEETVHRLLVRWAMRVLRSPDPTGDVPGTGEAPRHD